MRFLGCGFPQRAAAKIQAPPSQKWRADERDERIASIIVHIITIVREYMVEGKECNRVVMLV